MRTLPEMLKQRVESFNVGPSPDGEACIVKPVSHPQLPVEWTLDRFAAAELAAKLMDWIHSTHHEK